MNRITKATALAISLTGLAGCSGAASTPPAHSVSPTSTASSPNAPAQPASDPRKPLDLPSTGKVLLQVAGRTGPAQLPVIPRVDAGTVGVVVVCSGPGKITVDIGQMAKFGVVCGDKSPGQYNEIGLGHPRSRVAVTVEGANANTWAVTLGWYSAPPQT